MKNNERLIQFFDIRVHGRTLARDISHNLRSPKTLDELMHEFSQLRELNEARNRIKSNSKLELKLEDMEEREDSWVLLVNVVDGEAAHPVTNRLGGNQNDREVIELGNERGIESSSHIIIFKKKDSADKHLALYEKSTNVPFQRASSFLNHLLRLAAKKFPDGYKKPHPEASGKIINTYCVFTFLGHPSDEFREELEKGKITELHITTGIEKINGYDANVHAELIENEIKMKVGFTDVLMSGGNWSHLQKAIKYAESLDAQFVRIRFNDESGCGHTATIDTDTGQWDVDKYIKKRKIQSFGSTLKTAYPIIHDGIKDKMLELVR